MPGNEHVSTDVPIIPAREQQPPFGPKSSGKLMQTQQRGVQAREPKMASAVRDAAKQGPGTARHADGTPATGFASGNRGRTSGLASHL